jgi:hypothetical protein
VYRCTSEIFLILSKWIMSRICHLCNCSYRIEMKTFNRFKKLNFLTNIWLLSILKYLKKIKKIRRRWWRNFCCLPLLSLTSCSISPFFKMGADEAKSLRSMRSDVAGMNKLLKQQLRLGTTTLIFCSALLLLICN